MHPEWGAGDSPAWPKMDEYEMAVRARIISENTGKVVMTRFISGIPRKRYVICDGYRFPPGALGQDTTRPVIMISPAVMIMADRFEAEEVMYTRRWIDIDEVTDKHIDFVAME